MPDGYKSYSEAGKNDRARRPDEEPSPRVELTASAQRKLDRARASGSLRSARSAGKKRKSALDMARKYNQ